MYILSCHISERAILISNFNLAFPENNSVLVFKASALTLHSLSDQTNEKYIFDRSTCSLFSRCGFVLPAGTKKMCYLVCLTIISSHFLS